MRRKHLSSFAHSCSVVLRSQATRVFWSEWASSEECWYALECKTPLISTSTYFLQPSQCRKLGLTLFLQTKPVNLYGFESTTSPLNTLIFGRAPLDFDWTSAAPAWRYRHSLNSCSSCSTRSRNASTELIVTVWNGVITLNRLHKLRRCLHSRLLFLLESQNCWLNQLLRKTLIMGVVRSVDLSILWGMTKYRKGPQRTAKDPQRPAKEHYTGPQSWENCQTCNNFV